MPTATATATKKRTRTAVAPEPVVEEEVETAVDEEVIVDPNLNRLIEKWDKSIHNADQSWMQLAKYVRDKDISAKQLKHALVEIQGMKPSSAGVACSQLMRFQRSDEASEMLDRALSGEEEITVRDLRSANVLKGEKAERNPEEQAEKKLIAVARFAILKAEINDLSEYLGLARRTFKSVHAKITEAQAKATGNGDEDATEIEEDESEE